MPAFQPSPITRDDTLLGVCHALGEDFGFNPLYLRVALGIALFLSPIAVIGAYLVAGLLVAVMRWLVPNPALPAVEAEPAEQEAETLPLAA